MVIQVMRVDENFLVYFSVVYWSSISNENFPVVELGEIRLGNKKVKQQNNKPRPRAKTRRSTPPNRDRGATASW
jgi:hypothetical protein